MTADTAHFANATATSPDPSALPGPATCRQARLSRDPRLAGEVFPPRRTPRT